MYNNKYIQNSKFNKSIVDGILHTHCAHTYVYIGIGANSSKVFWGLLHIIFKKLYMLT